LFLELITKSLVEFRATWLGLKVAVIWHALHLYVGDN